MSGRRSAWTGRGGVPLVEVRSSPLEDPDAPAEWYDSYWVEPEHVEELRRFLERARRGRVPFLLVTLLAGPVVVLGFLFFGLWGTVVPLWLLALAMWKLPFATPQTVALLGFQRSIALVRIAAVGLLVLGLVLVLRPR